MQIQSFANIAGESVGTKAAKNAPTTSVLLLFQIEQSGDQLRVVDNDGSLYLGQAVAARVKQLLG